MIRRLGAAVVPLNTSFPPARLVTIARTAGLELHLTDRAPTYHAATDHEHAHFVCRGCHQVTSVGRSRIEHALGPLAEELGFRPDYGHLSVFGLCRSCAAKAPEHGA